MAQKYFAATSIINNGKLVKGGDEIVPSALPVAEGDKRVRMRRGQIQQLLVENAIVVLDENDKEKIAALKAEAENMNISGAFDRAPIFQKTYLPKGILWKNFDLFIKS